MNKKAGAKDVKKIKKIKKVDVDEEKSSFFFVALIGLLVVGAIGAVLFLAAGRESAIGVAPQAGGEGVGDHWHWAYSVNNCGTTLNAATNDNGDAGIHTHGRGLVHIHPFRPDAAGPNAKLGVFFEAFGGELTDDSYTPGSSEDPVTLSEEAGCDGQPATLKLAYWEDAYDDEAEPTIIEENLADFKFENDNGMFTLALVVEGQEIPRPPVDRVQLLSQTNGVEYTPSDAVLPEDAPQTEPVTESEEGAETTVADEAASDEESTDEAEEAAEDDAESAEEPTDTTEG